MKNFTLTLRKILTFFFALFLILLCSEVQAQKKIILSSVNYDVQSTNSNGAKFILDAKNNTQDEQLLFFNIKNNNSGAKNPDKSNSSGNVDLDYSVLDFKTKDEIQSATINAGETYRFIVLMKQSSNTPLKKWNHSKFEIYSKTKPSVKASLVLKTFVRDLSEE